jgi:ferredoxin
MPTQLPTLQTALKAETDKILGCIHCGLCLPACPTYQVLGNVRANVIIFHFKRDNAAEFCFDSIKTEARRKWRASLYPYLVRSGQPATLTIAKETFSGAPPFTLNPDADVTTSTSTYSLADR